MNDSKSFKASQAARSAAALAASTAPRMRPMASPQAVVESLTAAAIDRDAKSVSRHARLSVAAIMASRSPLIGTPDCIPRGIQYGTPDCTRRVFHCKIRRLPRVAPLKVVADRSDQRSKP